MAGSLKWQIYVADNSQQYAVYLDESNGLAGGFADVSAASGLSELPKGLKMRYVNCQDPVTGARRKIYLGTPNNPLKGGGQISLPLFSGKTAKAVNFQVTSYRAEQARRVFGADTGLNDGTAT